jgi:hypothetical protein
MTYMLCRNRVKDYQKWRPIFDAKAESAQDSGLRLAKLWRCVDQPNDVFFLFKVLDQATALAFILSPESAQTGIDAGVIDGEYHFVEEA